jgi:hypothetical protein
MGKCLTYSPILVPAKAAPTKSVLRPLLVALTDDAALEVEAIVTTTKTEGSARIVKRARARSAARTPPI